MTPTIEEVKRVAIERGISAEVRYEQIEELQAFAQHWIEVSRKAQREKDADLCRLLAEYELDAHSKTRNVAYLHKQAALSNAESAIRNNTGE